MTLQEWNDRYCSGERAAEDVEAAPTPLLVHLAERFEPGRALDLACGAGRNALYLARRGWKVTAIDGAPAAIEILRSRAADEDLNMETMVADLESPGFSITEGAWDLVAVCYYLQRDLFPRIRRATRPGGLVLAIVHIGEEGETPSPKRAERGELRLYFAGWAANPSVIPNQAAVAKRFFQLFPDTFDVLNIIYSPSFFQNRFHYLVRNAVKGIGAPLMDSGSRYGSPARLQGISVFPLSDFFDGGSVGVQHEFAHQWINYLNVPPLAAAIPHWPLSTMASGTMGFSIPPTGEGGSFPCLIMPDAAGVRLVANPDQPVYGDLDLYLMGLLPPEQVAEQIVLDNQSQSVFSQCNGSVYAGTFTRLHVADLIANSAIGPRVPAAVSAQKEFRTASIVVTRDSLLSPEAMSFYSFFAQRAEAQTPLSIHEGFLKAVAKPFALSTRGLGTMTARISQAPAIVSVVNGASFSAAPVAPGEFVSIFGTLLATALAGAPSVPLPTTLSGTSVLVNGSPAPLYYVSPTQVNFQLPFETQPGMASLTIKAGALSATGSLQVASAAPGILTYGANHAVAENADSSLNGPNSAAAPGTFITVYLTGIGALDNPVTTGAATPASPLARATLSASATIGGQPADLSLSD